MLWTQGIRRLAEVACEQGNLLEVGGLGVRRQVPHLHVLSHPLPKGGHGNLLCEMEGAASSTFMISQLSFFRNAGRMGRRIGHETCHAALPRSGFVQFLLCGAPHKRKGFDGLAMLAQEVLKRSPHSGHL